MPTYSSQNKPLGYRQLAVSTSSVALASATGGIPHGATRAVVDVEANDIRWRDDGTAPTASVGMLAKSNTLFELPSLQSINAFQAIRASADGTLNIAYYGS
jgi:hypothetical protein